MRAIMSQEDKVVPQSQRCRFWPAGLLIILSMVGLLTGCGGDAAPSRTVGGQVSSHLFVATISADAVETFGIDSLSGSLVNQGNLAGAGGGKPRSVAVDPTGRFLYVANAGSSNISAFVIDAATGKGTAIAGSPFATDTTPVQVIVDQHAQF